MANDGRDSVCRPITKRDFEYDGKMQANVALDYALMKELYPVSRLTGPANVLVMPGLHSANITAKLMQQAAGGTVIGPILIGLSKPAQVVQLGATIRRQRKAPGTINLVYAA